MSESKLDWEWQVVGFEGGLYCLELKGPGTDGGFLQYKGAVGSLDLVWDLLREVYSALGLGEPPAQERVLATPAGEYISGKDELN